MKQCAKCLLEKALSEFQKLSRASDGLHYRCKACVSAYEKSIRSPELAKLNNRKSYLRHREQRMAHQREYYQKNKAKCIESSMRWYAANLEKARNDRKRWQRAHANDPRYIESQRRGKRKWLANGGRENPQHCAAQAVRQAIKCGFLKRQPCEKCGTSDDIQAHHYLGYALEHWFHVQWLCHEHHCEAHGKTVNKENKSWV